ncbi:Hypothetical protein NTJ_14481 [Nesidiocoris tenuis]|uniref:Gustatory receptor n=1 Tax=Nesidiocoris tenuis TaxID=355587 RepID=A0ABN7BB96_9HEMI|nr:Hypothetical protein NTJ_14481 [Nesidiocoris tenuis]
MALIEVKHSTTDTTFARDSPLLIKHLHFFKFYGSLPILQGDYSFSEISKIYLFLMGGFSIVNAIHSFSPAEGTWVKYGPFTSILITFEQIVYAITPFLIAYGVARNRYKFETGLKSLIKIQNRLGIDRYAMFKSLKAAIVYNIFALGVFVGENLVQWLLDRKPLTLLIDSIGWAVFYILAFGPIYPLIYILECICLCFDHLSCARIDSDSKAHSFVQIYNRLIDVTINMNSYFDIPISITLLAGLMAIIDAVGYFLGEESVGLTSLPLMLYYSGMVVNIVSVIHFCQISVYKADQCNMVLFNCIVQHKHSIDVDNSLVLLHFCGQRQLIFKAGQCVVVDYQLGLSMFAAFITYIVLLYQIEYYPRVAQIKGNSNLPNRTGK